MALPGSTRKDYLRDAQSSTQQGDLLADNIRRGKCPPEKIYENVKSASADYAFAAKMYRSAGDLKEAEHSYAKAITIFDELGKPRNVGDAERIKQRLREGLGEIRAQRQRKGRDLGTLSTVLGVVGIFLILATNFSSLNVQLSPGVNSVNWQFWTGMILLLVGLVGGFFWVKNRK